MRPRVSLRTVFLLITCAAVFLYWRSRPAQIAHRFVNAVHSGQFSAADELLLADTDRIVVETVDRISQRSTIGFFAGASTPRQNTYQWLCGVCKVAFQLGDQHYEASVTARGLQKPRCIDRIGGGSFGGF